jgi:ABC-2 type transport system permease protein
MSKILTIGLKDLRVIFRDRSALILMLLAPLAMIVGVGLITGSFARDTGAVANVPVVVVIQDEGELGQALAELYASDALAELFAVTYESDPAQARALVADEQAAAAVIVPPGFSAAVEAGGATTIEVHRDPGQPVSSGVAVAVVESFLSEVETGRIGGQVAVEQLLKAGLISPAEVQETVRQLRQRQAGRPSAELIGLANTVAEGRSAVDFDPLAFLAPGMALLFLMFAVTLGGRSILAERREGTLARLLSTPTANGQVLTGKTFGIYFVGVAQMTILILASTLLFQLDWGAPLAVAALVLSVVAGAAGWGLLLAALAQTPSQASSIGTAVALVFGLVGGSFFGGSLGGPLALLSKITPNAWGQDGFALLARGGSLADLLPILAALWLMAAVLIAGAVLVFNRRGFLQR